MSLEVIKNLQAEIQALKEAQEASKAEFEAVQKDLGAVTDELAERKKTFDAEPQVSAEKVKETKARAANLHLKSVLSGKDITQFAEYKEIMGIAEKAIKPADTADWLKEEFSNDLLRELELQLKIENLFSKVVIPDGVSTLSIPTKNSYAEAYLIAPLDDAIESAFTDGKVTFDTKKIKSLITIAEEMKNETVISAIIDVVKTDLSDALARGSEKAIISGDTDLTATGINDVVAATDVRAAFDGLRKIGMSNTTDFGAGDSSTLLGKFREMRKSMGIYGLEQMDLVIVVNPTVAYRLLDMPEFLTMDKIGALATILTGQVGMIDGISVILSEYIPEDLTAAGDYDGVTTTFTAALMVNRKYFKVGTRNGVRVGEDTNIINDSTSYVASRYLDFKRTDVNGSPVAYGINISK